MTTILRKHQLIPYLQSPDPYSFPDRDTLQEYDDIVENMPHLKAMELEKYIKAFAGDLGLRKPVEFQYRLHGGDNPFVEALGTNPKQKFSKVNMKTPGFFEDNIWTPETLTREGYLRPRVEAMLKLNWQAEGRPSQDPIARKMDLSEDQVQIFQRYPDLAERYLSLELFKDLQEFQRRSLVSGTTNLPDTTFRQRDLEEAVREGNEEMFNRLIELFPEANLEGNFRKFLNHYKVPSYQWLKKLLEAGLDPNMEVKPYNRGKSLLNWTVQSLKNPEMAKLLLLQGAAVEPRLYGILDDEELNQMLDPELAALDLNWIPKIPGSGVIELKFGNEIQIRSLKPDKAYAMVKVSHPFETKFKNSDDIVEELRSNRDFAGVVGNAAYSSWAVFKFPSDLQKQAIKVVKKLRK